MGPDLRPEEPDIAALQQAVPEADQCAGEQGCPEGAGCVQILRHAKLLHIVALQRLLHQRVQDLRAPQQVTTLCLPRRQTCYMHHHEYAHTQQETSAPCALL